MNRLALAAAAFLVACSSDSGAPDASMSGMVDTHAAGGFSGGAAGAGSAGQAGKNAVGGSGGSTAHAGTGGTATGTGGAHGGTGGAHAGGQAGSATSGPGGAPGAGGMTNGQGGVGQAGTGPSAGGSGPGAGGAPTSTGGMPGAGAGGDAGSSSGQGGKANDSGSKLVVYWGQNGWGATHDDQATWEASLADTCTNNPHYDIVVMGFVISYVDPQNADGAPGLNFSSHCDTPFSSADPALLKCDAIAQGIKTCQALGKKVVLSLGGGAGAYGFTDDGQAKTFAKTVWDDFLGGGGSTRPFGDAVIDGIDLDIEGGSTTGYTAFVTSLRSLMSGDASKPYLITGAPQCPSPDAYLGPGPGKALGDAAHAFDYLWVQFYNNWCAYSNPSAFSDSFTAWSKLSADGGPKLVVGLPATTGAAPAGGFVARDQLAKLVDQVKADPSFAGIMLWDASFDQNSAENGVTYGSYAKSLLP